jgi:hypothetical protein
VPPDLKLLPDDIKKALLGKGLSELLRASQEFLIVTQAMEAYDIAVEIIDFVDKETDPATMVDGLNNPEGFSRQSAMEVVAAVRRLIFPLKDIVLMAKEHDAATGQN